MGIAKYSEWNKTKVDPWASHLLLWIDPNHFSTEKMYYERTCYDARVKRLKVFCTAVFLTRNFPEALDCKMSTWMDLVKDSSYHQSFLAMKPHLSHVLERIKRLRKQIAPSDHFCGCILDCADGYGKEKLKKIQKHSRKDIEASKNIEPYSVAEVVNKLKTEGCVAELKVLEGIDEGYVADCFEEGETVSHVDLLYSASLVSDVTIVRTSRQIFAIGKELTVQNMVLYKHPLSELRMESKMQHPLWSPKQDLLAECLLLK